jgi:hypothetical protein
MTTSVEKQCIMAGLRRICEDLNSAKVIQEDLTKSQSSLSSEGENIFEDDTKTTVIVPALGHDMGQLYTDGQIKLLALNV